MNKYGALARRHWKDHQPSRYSQLENPETFFTALGEQIASQVQSLALELESRERPQLNQMEFLEKVGRINAIQKQAEEIVFAELIWPPNQVEDSDTQETEDSSSLEDRLWELGAIEDEASGVMPRDRTHPLWKLWEIYLQENSTPEQSEAFHEAYRKWLSENPALLDL